MPQTVSCYTLLLGGSSYPVSGLCFFGRAAGFGGGQTIFLSSNTNKHMHEGVGKNTTTSTGLPSRPGIHATHLIPADMGSHFPSPCAHPALMASVGEQLTMCHMKDFERSYLLWQTKVWRRTVTPLLLMTWQSTTLTVNLSWCKMIDSNNDLSPDEPRK